MSVVIIPVRVNIFFNMTACFQFGEDAWKLRKMVHCKNHGSIQVSVYYLLKKCYEHSTAQNEKNISSLLFYL